MTPPFHHGQPRHTKEKYPYGQRRRPREFFLYFHITPFNHFRLRQHQRPRTAVGALNHRAIGVTQQIKRSEHLVTYRNRTVSLRPQTNVITQFRPGMLSRILMDNLTIRTDSVLLRINDLSFHSFLYTVACPRRTIIIKKVITIFPVFRTHILYQQRPKPFLLRCPQVQHLLIDYRPTLFIFLGKVSKRQGANLIIALTARKAPYKIRTVEAEHTVIKNPVLPRGI